MTLPPNYSSLEALQMSHTVTQTAIFHVSREIFSRYLKAEGFKRRSNHLYREYGDVIHGIHFQASQSNSSREGKFTINLVVTSPAIYSFYTGRPLPSNPATATVPIVERIGRLMPQHNDQWWSVAPETDLSELTTEVCSAILEYGLPYFNDYSEANDIIRKLRIEHVLPGLVERTQADF